jgi:hypothetical protein
LRIGQQATRYPERMHRWPGRRPRRLRGLPRRVARFVKALFGGGGSWRDTWSDDAEGGVGVREPRRPLTPSLTGAAALELPPEDGDES